MGKAQRQECEVAAHMVSSDSKQGDVKAEAQLALFFVFSPGPQDME